MSSAYKRARKIINDFSNPLIDNDILIQETNDPETIKELLKIIVDLEHWVKDAKEILRRG